MRNLTKTLLPFLFVFSLFFTISCEKSESIPQENIIEKTIVLNESKIVSASEGNVVLTGDQTDIQANDILVSGANTNAPRGFLRKVTNVQNQDNQISVQTTDATIEEAVEYLFENGESHNASFSHTFSDEDFSSKSLGPKNSLEPIIRDIDERIVKNIGGVDVSLQVTGSIKITPTLNSDIKISKNVFGVPKLENMSFVTSINSDFSVAIISELSGDINEEFRLAAFDVPPVTLYVGIPITFLTKLTLDIGLVGELDGYLSYSYYNNSTLSAGFEYSDGWRLLDSNGFTPNSVNYDVFGNLDGNIKAYLKPEISVSLYDKDFVTSGINVAPYAKFESVLSNNHIDWSIKGGINTHAYFRADIFGFIDLIEDKEWNDFIDFPVYDIASGLSDIYVKEKLFGNWQLNERTESGGTVNLKDCEKEITWDFFTNMTMKFVSFDVLDSNGDCAYIDEGTLNVNWELNGDTIRLYKDSAEILIKILKLTNSTLKIEFLDGQGDIGTATMIKQ